jgi:hypothetical protein
METDSEFSHHKLIRCGEMQGARDTHFNEEPAPNKNRMKTVVIGLAIIVVAVVELSLVQHTKAETNANTTAPQLTPDVSELSGSGSDPDITPIPRLCEEGGHVYGMFFPVSADEWTWSRGGMGLLYAIGLIYCFIGVAIYSGELLWRAAG